MKEGDGDRVRESVQDYFVDHVTPGANRVPAHTQENYPETFPNRGPVRRSHLPARSDESPVCGSGSVGVYAPTSGIVHKNKSTKQDIEQKRKSDIRHSWILSHLHSENCCLIQLGTKDWNTLLVLFFN